MYGIHRPCDTCVYEPHCIEAKGCRQWKAWFRAYWRELRKVAKKGRERK